MSEPGKLKLFILDHEGQKVFLQAHQRYPYFLPADTLLPTSIQGFSLCNPVNKTPYAGFYCCPYVSRQGWRVEKVLRVSRILFSFPPEEPDGAVFKAMIREINEIGKRAGVNQIEIELYREIKSNIFFPSTDSSVNTYNDPGWTGFFEREGFSCYSTKVCYEFGLDQVKWIEGSPVVVRKINMTCEADQKRYYDLWNSSGNCPYPLTRNKFWYPNVFGWPRAWYADIARVLTREDSILFAEKDGKCVGFTHWWPNLYPLLTSGGRKAILGQETSDDGPFEGIQGGKVFKLIVDKRSGRDREVIERALMAGAFKLMKEKYGLKTCQVGNLLPDRRETLSFLSDIGGRKVHEFWLMRKRVFL